MNEDPNLKWDGSRWLRWDGTQWVPAAPTPSSSEKSRTGLYIAIAAGGCFLVLILVLVGAAIASRSGSNVDQAQTPGPVITLPTPVASSAQPSLPTTAPSTTAPPAPTTLAPATKAPASLTETSAIALVTTFLSDASQGNSAGASAVTTSRFSSRNTADYYQLAASELQKFDVVSAESSPDGGYLVFVKEKWATGTWTKWYRVIMKNGQLVIDDVGAE